MNINNVNNFIIINMKFHFTFLSKDVANDKSDDAYNLVRDLEVLRENCRVKGDYAKVGQIT